MTTDERASALNREISAPGSCHDPEVQPFLEVTSALSREAEAPSAPLDPGVAATQRATLMSRANELKAEATAPAAAPAEAKKTIPSRPLKNPLKIKDPDREPIQRKLQRLWSAWRRTLVPAAVFALILLMLVGPFMPYLQNSKNPNSITATLSELIIPAANAADAFTFTADTKDTAGVSPSSTFTVQTKVDVSADDIKTHLVLAKAVLGDASSTTVGFTVEKTGDHTFKITPDGSLEAGSVYQAKIKTTLRDDSGDRTGRTFTWALQTKDLFRVLSTVPGQNSNNVPVNTGIEFSMSMKGWTDATSSFSITPAAVGRFETHGRTLAFVPEQPLQYGTLYTVTMKSSWGVAGSDLTLGKDIKLQFETQRQSLTADSKPLSTIYPIDNHESIVPGKPAAIYVYTSGDVATSTVTGFRLTADEAKTYLEEEMRIPSFANCTIQSGMLQQKYAKNQAFEFSATPYGTKEVWSYAPKKIDLPTDLPEGKYLVRLTSKDNLLSWLYLESTSVAVYLMSANDRTLIWAVDAIGNSPIQNIPVTVGSEKQATDAQGLAYVKTPEVITSTTTHDGVVLQVGEGSHSAYVSFAPDAANIYGQWYQYRPMGDDNIAAFLHTDRPLYHLADEAKLSGIIQERKGSGPPTGSVTIELRKTDYYDYFWRGPKSKTYKQVTVTPDAQGFFTASIDWSNLAPDSYQLVLVHDGTDLYSDYIDVRDFEKPAYTIGSTTDKSDYFNGEKISYAVNASFFDGTPVSNLEVQADLSGQDQKKQNINQDGETTFEYQANAPLCTSLNPDDYCNEPDGQSLSAHPTLGEQADIQTNDYIMVWNSRVLLNSKTTDKNGTATVSYTLQKVTLPASRNEDAIPQDKWPSAPGKAVSGTIYEYWWEGTPAGTGYDPIEKKTYPIVNYIEKSATVGTFTLTTDANGKAATSFPMKKDRYYRVIASAKDDTGSMSIDRSYASDYWGAQYRPSENSAQAVPLEFKNTDPSVQDGTNPPFKIGDHASFGFFRKADPVPSQPHPTFLYVQAIQGILDAKVSNLSTDEFTFTNDHVPNMTLWGIAFIDGAFQDFTTYCYFDTTSRNATVQVTTDQKTYAPGATAKVNVAVTDPAGKPLSNARVTLDIVDEALYAATWNSINNDPKDGLYRPVSNGIILTHKSLERVDMYASGAEKGGGGGDANQVRTNFKDTAAYTVVTTDANGKASASIQLPDNITSWRVTAVAATPDRYAGSSISKIPVTKPVFVTAVIPPRLTSSDQMQIKLRAFGTGLKTGEGVDFTVDAPSAGIKNATVHANAFDSAYLPVQKLAAGDYPITIRVKSSTGQDAFLRHITVVDNIFTRMEAVRIDAKEGTTLGDLGGLPEVDVRFLPMTRAQYLNDLNRMTWTNSERVESKIGSTIANDLLVNYFSDLPNHQATTTKETLKPYQQMDGGIALVRYGGSDPEVTSKVAMIAPEYFDRVAMASYLGQLLSMNDQPREAQLRALSGLAALGEPVLLELQAASAQKDLSWRETLSVAGGLAAIGDSETANSLLNTIIQKGEKQDDRMMIRVSDKEAENIEATAETARIAELLANPSASALRAWVRNNWNKDAFTPLDRIGFLKIAVPNAIGRDVTIVYTAGNGNQTIKLMNGWPQTVTFTADEAKAFKIISTDAPAAISFNRPTTDPITPSKDLTITRTYKNEKGEVTDHFKEGELVTVTLHITIADTAPDGCYDIHDQLPAGLGAFGFTPGWYFNDRDSNPTFVECKSKTYKPGDDTYTARVIAKGTYTALQAVVQHEQTPSVANLTEQQTITIE